MKRGYIFIVLLLYALLFYSGKFIFPFAVAMGNDLHYAQRYQSEDAGPEIEIAPPMGACDGIPSGNDAHDELAPVLISAAISFLIGASCKTPERGEFSCAG